MTVFDQFQVTKPRFLIGQAVQVVGKYAAEWRGEQCVITGMSWNGPYGMWSIEIMTRDEIERGCGSTDLWSESDLAEVHYDKTEGSTDA